MFWGFNVTNGKYVARLKFLTGMFSVYIRLCNIGCFAFDN